MTSSIQYLTSEVGKFATFRRRSPTRLAVRAAPARVCCRVVARPGQATRRPHGWINERLTGGWGRAPEGQGAEAKGDVAEHRCCTIVQHFRRFIGMASTLGFRPTPDDERILREAARPGESRSDVLRRALRLLDHDAWLAQFHRDAEGLKHEDVNADTEAW